MQRKIPVSVPVTQRKTATCDGLGRLYSLDNIVGKFFIGKMMVLHCHPFGTTSHLCSTLVVDLPHQKCSKMQPHGTPTVYHISIHFWPEKLIKNYRSLYVFHKRFR